MFNEGLFKEQLKLFKQNSKEDIDVAYNVLNTIELYNKENIYNINMIIDSKEEAEDFIKRVEIPNEEWKTLTDIIVDVRKEKLEKLGQVAEEKIKYIQQLLSKDDYIGLHKELEGIFLHKVVFSMIKRFVQKTEKLGIERVCEVINQYRDRGLSTTICMLQ